MGVNRGVYNRGSSESCVGVNRGGTIIKWWQRVVCVRESGGYTH